MFSFLKFSGFVAERIDLRYFLSFGMIMSGLFTVLFGAAYYWNIHDISYFIFIQVRERESSCVRGVIEP